MCCVAELAKGQTLVTDGLKYLSLSSCEICFIKIYMYIIPVVDKAVCVFINIFSLSKFLLKI